MLKYAKLNYTINALSSKSYLGDFIEYDFENSFDYIVSNPPFYDSSVIQSQNKRLNIARYAHHLPIEKFIKKVKTILRPRGRFIFCYDAKQIDRLLYTLMENKINPEVLRFVHSKVDRESKLVMISARANSKSMMRVLPPLVVFDDDSNYLDEAKMAFIRASTHSIKGDYSIEC
jgi:tRNA1(Val) A37 N6-methylase TrmN6